MDLIQYDGGIIINQVDTQNETYGSEPSYSIHRSINPSQPLLFHPVSRFEEAAAAASDREKKRKGKVSE